MQVILGSLVPVVAYLLSLKAHNSMNFQPICKISKLRDRVVFPYPVHILVVFQYSIES